MGAGTACAALAVTALGCMPGMVVTQIVLRRGKSHNGAILHQHTQAQSHADPFLHFLAHSHVGFLLGENMAEAVASDLTNSDSKVPHCQKDTVTHNSVYHIYISIQHQNFKSDFILLFLKFFRQQPPDLPQSRNHSASDIHSAYAFVFFEMSF